MSEPPIRRAGSAAIVRRRWPGRGTRSSTRVARAAWPVLLAALVLVGGLDLHSPGASHETLASLSGNHGQVYFEGASHPVQPRHAETAKAAQRPYCALCLNRLQSMGDRPALATRLATPLAGPLPAAAVAVSPLRRSQRPAGARAPPLA
jgi:hypothetical protein